MGRRRCRNGAGDGLIFSDGEGVRVEPCNRNWIGHRTILLRDIRVSQSVLSDLPLGPFGQY